MTWRTRYHPRLGRHAGGALGQRHRPGRAAAGNMLGGDESDDRLPYFFTDQYDLGMEYVGNIGPDGLRRGGRSAATPADGCSRPSG